MTAATGGPVDDEGVAFPEVDGRRSSTATGRAVFADAARAVDAGLADAIAGEPRWRARYGDHARRLLEVRVGDPGGAVAAAAAGLASLHRRMVVAREGAARPLADLADLPAGPVPATAEVRGTGRGAPELALPWKGELLRGDALHRHLDAWVAAGTVEPDAAEAVRTVVADPGWLDLSDQQVLVVGAAAEMGPLPVLADWGAHVLALDLPRPQLWHDVLRHVRAGRGRASIPVARALPPDADGGAIAGAAGADQLTAQPELLAWADRTAAAGPLAGGAGADADGAAVVRVAAAAARAHRGAGRPPRRRRDGRAGHPHRRLRGRRGRGDRGGPALERARGDRARRAALSRGRLFAPTYAGTVAAGGDLRLGVVDCVVPQQGPNYLLAKAVQRWRATVAREGGRVASVHVAPMTRTRSVLRNRVLAAGYAGAGRFGVEIFDPATSRTLMAALLVHDLRNPAAAANPAAPLSHPLRLESAAAVHGGLWRMPYALRSVLPPAVGLGLLTRGR